MPPRPAKPCSYPGCRALVRDGGSRCERHPYAKTVDQQRGSADERGYTWAWRQAALRYLRENPLCAACKRKGLLELATEVDHIVPHKGDQKLFWDRKNWQGLSKRCHSIKTATEDGGYGR